MDHLVNDMKVVAYPICYLNSFKNLNKIEKFLATRGCKTHATFPCW